jgi:xanthine dehydrogenase small subunit
VDARALRTVDELYPPHAIVSDLIKCADESVHVEDQKTFFKPATVDEAVRFRSENNDCMIISGGTDVGVQMNKCLRDPRSILSLAGMQSLRGIEVKDGAIVAGANATIAELEFFTRDMLPEYSRLLYYFGSPPIKNAATLGGNIGNGSPIADTIPCIYAMNGEVELVGLSGTRRVNIHDYYTGYKKTVQKPDELIARVIIPLPRAGETLKLYKISRRKDLDISAFTAAIWMRCSSNGVTSVTPSSTIDDIRIVYGGVAANILRLRETEAFLRGKAFSLSNLQRAGKIARGEIAPISDVRGSADYRLQLAENTLIKFFIDVSGTPSDNGNGWHDGNGDGNGQSHDPMLDHIAGEVH